MNEGKPIHFETPDGRVIISPRAFSDTIGVDPSNLTQFAPEGTYVYGLRETPDRGPFKEGPVHEPSGGVIYFDNRVTNEDLQALTRILDLKGRDSRDYAAFASTSSSPGTEGYLTQMRLVDKFGLRHLFHSINDEEYEAFPQQELTAAQALYAFIEDQRRKYGTSFGSPQLEGKFGGDGNFAREELSFGLMVENNYYGIYRIWSRAWLVTK